MPTISEKNTDKIGRKGPTLHSGIETISSFDILFSNFFLHFSLFLQSSLSSTARQALELS